MLALKTLQELISEEAGKPIVVSYVKDTIILKQFTTHFYGC